MAVTEVGLTGAEIVKSQEWSIIKSACLTLRNHQVHDGSIPDTSSHEICADAVGQISNSLRQIAEQIIHDRDYLLSASQDFEAWARSGFGVPDFFDSLSAFEPHSNRVNGIPHLVIFPTYTQNGSTDRFVEAVVLEVIWPDFVAELEAGEYSNPAFVPIRFLDFTPGYLTNSAVLFPESVSVIPRVPFDSPDGAKGELPQFNWGGIFADREAARFRRVVSAAAEITHIDLPAAARDLLSNQQLAEDTFVMWDLIHDRTHMRGDLPFDPFMIKQRMPFFLYGLEELRCDLTAFRESVKLFRAKDTSSELRKYSQLVQYAVLFDRIFRFPLSGNRTRNYDSVAGQLMFAYLHQHRVLHWTDTSLSIDWDNLPDVMVNLSDEINELYWKSIDRPKVVHWLAAYDLVTSVLAPHPASKWSKRDLPLLGTTSELTDQVLDDEFPLSMFYEALNKKMVAVIQSTIGITGKD